MNVCRPKILHIITSLAVGGAQRHLLRLIEGLSEDYECHLIYFKDDDLLEEFKEVADSVTKVQMDGVFGFLRMPSLVRQVARGDYSFVHTHLLKADCWGMVASKIAGVDCVISSKHNAEAALQNVFVRIIHSWISRANRRIIALSSAVAEYMIQHGGVSGPRLIVIHYGIDELPKHTHAPGVSLIRKELGVPARAPIAVCVARIDPQKNHQLLIQAWDRVVMSHPNAYLIIIGGTQLGGNNYVQYLCNMVAEMGLENRVLFTGLRSDVDDFLMTADIAVMSSRWEGLGLALLEAMKYGLPVVATRVGGIVEVVDDGITGILVEDGDASALANAIQTVLSDTDKAKEMGEAGRRRIATYFAADDMIAKTLAVYSEVSMR